MTILRIVLLCLLAGMGLKAQAQRTLVPIVSFHDIPVTVATQARLTNDDVKNAFLAAGEEAKWQIVPTGDGVLEATYVKQNKHTIMLTIRYDAQKYSVLFKGSDNMKQRIGQPMSEAVAAAAESKQRQLFAARPETPYLKADPQAVIHPFYEHWVYDLLERVRLKLSRTP